MTVTRHARAVGRRLAETRVAAQKAVYREKLRRLQAAVDPPLSNSELAAGLDLPSTSIGRFLSESPKLAKARPDGETRALIDALLAGDLLLGVEDAVGGAKRDVLVLEERDVLRLSKRYRVTNLAGGPVPSRLESSTDWNDAGAWNLFSSDEKPPEKAGASPNLATAPLEARRLDDLLLAPIGLGCMRLSTAGRPDEDDARAVLHAALDRGLETAPDGASLLWDTADSYALDADDVGHNERLIASVLAEHADDRSRVVVATKAGLVRPGGKWLPDGRPEHLREACEGSLRRLDPPGGALDLFLLHVVDPKVPFEESVGALARLHEEGKVRRVGLCNVNADQLDAARAIVPIVAVQNGCNFRDKSALEKGFVERCHELGVTFVAHSPIGGHRGVERVDRDRALVKVAQRHDAEGHSTSARQAALAWLLRMGPGIVPIPGATRVESVQASLDAASLPLDENDWKLLDARRPWAETVRRELWSHGEAFQARAPEVVIVMGPPAAGKTSRVAPFLDRGFLRLNRDEEGGKLDDLVPKLASALEAGQRRVVLDNTYPTRQSRRGVLDAARRHGVPVRCVWLDAPEREAFYNACRRMLERHGRILGPDEIKQLSREDPNMLPPAAIHAWFTRFEEPSEAEGFASVERVPFERRTSGENRAKGLILDVDGTLRRSKGPAPFPLHPDEVEILPHRREVLDRHIQDGWRLFAVSNQSGIGRGQVDEATVEACFERTWELLGHRPEEVLYCPYAATSAGVWCRKPMPGLGVAILEKHDLDRAGSLVVGDLDSDRDFATNLGVPYLDAEAFFTD